MADGRDIAYVNETLVNTTSDAAGSFADSRTVVLTGSIEGQEVVVRLKPSVYEWSNPAEGGVFPVRRVKRLTIDGQPVGKAKFCGYKAHDNELVTMDAKRGHIKRYTLDDAPVFLRHP